jgi:probable HAF family extracellular repeat protein
VLECQGPGGTRSAEALVVIALQKYSWIGLPFERAVALNDRGDATGNLYRKEAGVWFPRVGVAYINGAAVGFDFGNTTPPVYQSTAGDINARQEVLVYTNLPYCFIYRAGVLAPMVGVPCEAINDRGHMAGSVMVDLGGRSASQAALYVDGVSVLVDMPAGTDGYAVDLNESDQMAGNFRTAGDTSTTQPFLYSGGRMINLGTLGGRPSYAWAINESGVVVGESTLANGNIHAFRYDTLGMADLGTLGGDYSTARGINDSGTVVGKAQRAGASGCCSAFLFDHGRMYDLNDYLSPAMAHRLDEAADINNLGQIVASACWSEETTTVPPISIRSCRAYLLTPIPGSDGR